MFFVEWKKMSVVAKELGVSKDVVKYHKKSLPEGEIGWDEGKVILSPAGVDFIKSRLKKETYHENFEKYTRDKLKNIESRLELMDEFLIKKLLIEKQTESIPERKLNVAAKSEATLLDELDNVLTDDFKQWYCELKGYELWEEWDLSLVRVMDLIRYLKQK